MTKKRRRPDYTSMISDIPMKHRKRDVKVLPEVKEALEAAEGIGLVRLGCRKIDMTSEERQDATVSLLLEELGLPADYDGFTETAKLALTNLCAALAALAARKGGSQLQATGPAAGPAASQRCAVAWVAGVLAKQGAGAPTLAPTAEG